MGLLYIPDILNICEMADIKITKLFKEESRNGVAPSQTLLQAPHR